MYVFILRDLKEISNKTTKWNKNLNKLKLKLNKQKPPTKHNQKPKLYPPSPYGPLKGYFCVVNLWIYVECHEAQHKC